MKKLPAVLPIFSVLLPMICLAVTMASAQPLTPAFARDDRAATANARGIAVADLNRDGWLDIVTANHGPDGIAILLSRGEAGGFASSFISIPGGPFDVATGDLNKDGVPDIAVAAPDTASIVVVFGNAAGGFAAPLKVATANSRGLTIADIDGDGNLDLVYTLWDSGRVQILNGDGHGAFTARIASMAVGINPQGVTAADFNLDGRMDLAVASSGSVGISVLSQSASGTFTRGDVVGPNSQNVIVAADLNSDGRPDIAAASTNTNEITVYEVRPGVGTTLLVYQSGGSSIRGIAAADLNRDGNVDILVAGRGTNTVQVLLGQGGGLFHQPAVGFAAGAGSRTVATGDFDNDGRIDVASGNEFASTVTVLSNTTAFTKSAFAFSKSVIGGDGNGFGGFTEADVADLDRDGTLDLITQGFSGGIAVLYGNGASLNLTTRAVGPRSTRAADVNGDGVPDIVYIDGDTNSNFWVNVYLGNRAGGFTVGQTIAIPMNGFTVTPVDLNLDGKVDLVAGGFSFSSTQHPLQVFLGGGDGTFTLASQPDLPPSSAWVSVGDVNRDGFPDIVTTSSSAFPNRPGVVRVWPNDRTGHFATASQTVEIPEFQGLFAGSLGDLDHDGFLDLVTTGSRSGPQFMDVFTVMKGGPSGFAAPAIAKGSMSRMFLSDLTLDGNLDAISEDGQLFAGRGDGTFDPPLGFDFFAAGMKVLDFNRDGLPDIVSGFAQGTAQVVLNLRRDTNTPPTVNAGADRTITYFDQLGDADLEFEPVGSDADLHALQWQWRDESGSVICDCQFAGPGTRPPGVYTFTVTVNDGRGGTASDSVKLTITPGKESVTHVGSLSVARDEHGTWSALADGTAAAGAALRDAQLDRPKVTAPLANPTNYVDVFVPADPTQTYKLWVRLKATGDSFSNDSLWLQFDNAVDQNGRTLAPGTTSGIEVVLEECSGCGLSGWGWRDEAWGQRGATGAMTLRFTQGGFQRVRIQTREDGVMIDQIVLSAEQYRTTRPGTVKNDATILPQTPRF